MLYDQILSEQEFKMKEKPKLRLKTKAESRPETLYESPKVQDHHTTDTISPMQTKFDLNEILEPNPN